MWSQYKPALDSISLSHQLSVSFRLSFPVCLPSFWTEAPCLCAWRQKRCCNRWCLWQPGQVASPDCIRAMTCSKRQRGGEGERSATCQQFTRKRKTLKCVRPREVRVWHRRGVEVGLKEIRRQQERGDRKKAQGCSAPESSYCLESNLRNTFLKFSCLSKTSRKLVLFMCSLCTLQHYK